MKNRSANILITALILLAVFAVALAMFIEYAHERFDEDITVSADGVTHSVKAVRGLKLNPTESKEYDVNLVCLASGDYHITLDLKEKKDGGMKSFVDVTVCLDGKAVYEGPLRELLDTDKVVEFDGTLEEEDPLPVTIRYTMPHYVGNEAQGTTADFNVKFIIEKK